MVHVYFFVPVFLQRFYFLLEYVMYVYEIGEIYGNIVKIFYNSYI